MEKNQLYSSRRHVFAGGRALLVSAGLGLVLGAGGMALPVLAYADTTPAATEETSEVIATVSSEQELREALAKVDSTKWNVTQIIKLDSDITLSDSVSLSGVPSGVHVAIDGQSHTISFNADTTPYAFKNPNHVTITNVAFTNTGSAQTGSAVLEEGGLISLDNCTFVNCSQAVAYDLYADGGTIAITNSTFDATAVGLAWVVYSDYDPYVYGRFPEVAFEGNKATDGSAVPSCPEPADALVKVSTDTGIAVAYFTVSDDFVFAFQNPGLFYTVELLDDITVNQRMGVYGYTLQGNGHTIHLASPLEKGQSFMGFTAYGGEALTDRVAAVKNVTFDLAGNADYAIRTYDSPNLNLIENCTIRGANVAGMSCSCDSVVVRNTTFVLGNDAIANVELTGPASGIEHIVLESSNTYQAGVPIALMDGESIEAYKNWFSLSDKSHAAIVDALNEAEMINLPLYYNAELDIATTDPVETPEEPEDPDVPDTPDTPDVPAEDEEIESDVVDTEGGTVEVTPAKPGEPAVVDPAPEAGQEVRDVQVTDADGNAVDVIDNGDGTWSFVMPEGGATVEVVFGCDGGDLCDTHKFTDIDQDQWYHDAVDWAVTQGIMNGYAGTDAFGPNDTLTREQAAAVLYNYLGEGDTASDDANLSDVAQDQWYSAAVNWAVANGIMSGYEGSGSFGIGDALSREQFCAVVANAVGADLSAVDESVLDAFPDADNISDWARPAVAWAVQAGVINGVDLGDGTRELSATRDITRSEMAAMMMNAVESGVLNK